MNRLNFYLNFYLKELFQKKWLFLLLAWVISFFGIFFVILIPDQYRTYAGISIDTDKLLSQVVGDSAFSLEKSTRSQAIKVSQIIYSTDNLRKVLREIDPESYQYSRREEILIVERMRENLSFKDISKDYYEMSYIHSDPDLAYKTLKAILANFIEKNVQKLSSNSEQAEIISSDALKIRKREYALLQKQYTDFKQENIEIIDPNGALVISLRKAEHFIAEYFPVRQRYISRISNLKNLLSQTPKNIQNANIIDPACDLSDFYKQKNTLVARGFTRSHPDVIYLNEIIDEAKKQCPEQNKKNVSNNPAYLQLTSELQIAKEDLKSHESSYKQYQNEVIEIQAKLAKQPVIIEKLATLEGKKNKAQTNLGIADLKNDRLQETIDLNRKTGLVKYDVVQRVYYPVKPEKPNRFLLFIGCFIASIFGAAGVIILQVQLEQRMPTVYHLREAFDLPILGAVSKVSHEGSPELKIKDNIVWISGFILLLALYSFLVWNYAIAFTRPEFSSFFEKLHSIINLVI